MIERREAPTDSLIRDELLALSMAIREPEPEEHSLERLLAKM